MTFLRIPSFFLVISFLFEAALPGVPGALHPRNYSKKDGLADISVYCTLQDAKGFLWFGTRNGLSRFDGMTFKNYNKKDGLPGNHITTLLEDSKGNTWIGTLKGGVSRFSSGEFTNYETRHGLPDNHVLSIAEGKNGILWVGTAKGLCCFTGREFNKNSIPGEPVEKTVTAIAADGDGGDGTLWVGTTDGLYRLENNRFTGYTTAEGLADNYAVGLLTDSKGRLWIGTKNGLNCYHKGKFTTYTRKDGLNHDSVNCIVEDDEGNILVGTWNGISIFSGGKFVNYTNDLPNNFVNSILQDREGNTWAATYDGISRISTLKIESFSIEDGLIDNVVRYIIRDKKGRYWIGTGGGLNCYSNGKFTAYTKEDGLVSDNIVSLLEDRRGYIWISTPEGLSVFSSGTFKNYTQSHGLTGNITFDMTEDRDGTIWIGNRKGVDRFDYRTGTFSPFPYNFGDSHVERILQDSNGVLWFSSENGLYTFDGNTFTRFTTRDGLPDDSITALYEDGRGRIWVGTESGLSRFHNIDNPTFTTYTTADGLPDDKCRFILEDDNKNLWIGTTSGLACFDGGSFKSYTVKSHGMISDFWFSGLKDDRGRLWFGTPQGMTRFHPPLKINTVPPPVYITDVKVLEKDVPLQKMAPLEYHRNIIRIGFIGLCFTSPRSVVYKYRLKGIDDDWKETGDRSLFYPYLPAGNYRFEVKAVNNDGIESLKPAELAFEIRPPFWKTWWFHGLMILFIFSILIAVVRWKFKRANEKLLLKSRTRQLVMSQRMELMGMLAASAVHDLKDLLSIIIGYSEIVAEQYDPDDKNYEYNENIKSTANTAAQVVKQILAFARQKHDENDAADLSALLNDILDILKITAPSEVKVLWEPPPDEILFHINPTRFQQLVMNLCINAVHAMPHGGELEISLYKEENGRIKITVSDTGTGIDEQVVEKIFDPLFTTREEGKGTGLGLFVVKQIVDEYKGKIDVQTHLNKGTIFTIIF